MIINTHLLPVDFLPSFCPHGYANGYISVPPEHPWFGKHYDDIECDIHGGLTYSDNHLPKQLPDGLWYIGFDTVHCDDNINNCDETYCKEQVEFLKRQAEKVFNTISSPSKTT